MVKILRTIVAGLSILIVLAIIVSTVACASTSSLSYMSDDVLKNLGFISLDNVNNGTYTYKVNAHVENNINFQTGENNNVTANWDFTSIESIGITSLINKNNNLGWTNNINNFLQKKLQLKLNPKKEFNLAELDAYHLKVLNNKLKVINIDDSYSVSEQNIAVQWWKSSRNGPIFLKHAKFKLHITDSIINRPSWSASKSDWFDQIKLTNILNDTYNDNNLNVTNLNNAFTKKAKSALNSYSSLLNIRRFKINSATKEYKYDSNPFGWNGFYWAIDFSLNNGTINFSFEVRL